MFFNRYYKVARKKSAVKSRRASVKRGNILKVKKPAKNNGRVLKSDNFWLIQAYFVVLAIDKTIVICYYLPSAQRGTIL